MNIGQAARNQWMMYSIASRGTGSSFSSGPLKGLNKQSAGDDGDNFFSTPAALQGTVRQIAKRLHEASFSSDSAAGDAGAGLTQGVSTSKGDPAMEALRKHLGAKVESLQQSYQPGKTTLSGNFEQLQAIAESYVSRLQSVPLSDETTKKIQELALRDAKNSAGTQEDGADTTAVSQMDRLSFIQEEVQKFAPSKRTAAFNTINKVWESELDRIGAYIKEKNPDWKAWGDKFDVSSLDGYKPGLDVWA